MTSKLDTVRHFLQQNAIRPALATQVQKQVLRKLTEQRPLTVEEVPAFELLSPSLRLELYHETRRCHLIGHPAFKLWDHMEPSTFNEFCIHAVTFACVSPQETLFSP